MPTRSIHYATVFSDAQHMIGNTLLYLRAGRGDRRRAHPGLAIAWLILRTALPARRWLDSLASIALAIPGLVLAIGYLRLLKGINILHRLARGHELVLIMLAYAVRRLPYALRACMAALQQLHLSLEEAAQEAWARRAGYRTALVMVPLMAGGILAGFVTGFITAAVELSATPSCYDLGREPGADELRHLPLHAERVQGAGPARRSACWPWLSWRWAPWASHRFAERTRAARSPAS